MRIEPRPVDVICLHTQDGSTIPLKIRLTDDDGLLQTYTIKNYRDLSHNGSREMPDGVFVGNKTLVFECHIIDFGRQRLIRLYKEPEEDIWKITC